MQIFFDFDVGVVLAVVLRESDGVPLVPCRDLPVEGVTRTFSVTRVPVSGQ